MKLFIYETEAFENGEFNIIDTIDGVNNEDCENKASELYSDTDYYKWSYAEV